MLCVDIRPASVDPVPHAAINPRSTTSSTAVPETGKPSPPRACRARNLYPRGPHQHRVRDISTIAVNIRSELPAWPRHGGSTRSASNLMPWTTASLIADGVLFERPLATGAAAPMGGNPSPRHPRAAHRSGLEGQYLSQGLIDTVGATPTVEVFATSGHGLFENAAADAVRCRRFVHGRRDGREVPPLVRAPVMFKLVRAS